MAAALAALILTIPAPGNGIIRNSSATDTGGGEDAGRSATGIVPDEITGTWTIVPVSPAGVIRYDLLTIERRRGALSGTLDLLPAEGHPVQLESVRFAQGALAFRTFYPDDDGGPAHEILWQGRLVNPAELRLTRQSPGQQPEQVVLRKRSRDEIAALESDIARNLTTARIALPALRTLPTNGLAPTPPMGWNSWNHFATTVDDAVVRAAADALVSSGLRAAGYVYVNIDDGWQGRRAADGALQPNSKFPDMKALADYVHSKGLKLGLYTSPGPTSCAGYVGSHGHETEDARAFAHWGVDLLKYDWCSAAALYHSQPQMQALYQKMGAALQSSGRSIVFSLCQYGLFDVGAWGRAVGGDLWRTGSDSDLGDRWASVNARFDTDGKSEDAGPGAWNDPDILLIGNGGLNSDESRTHMTLWVMLAAPLLLGDDLSRITPEEKRIVSNAEVLAVDQDRLGRQGRRVSKQGPLEIWTKPLTAGKTAVALFNRGPTPSALTVVWSELGLAAPTHARDAWRGVDLQSIGTSYTVQLPAHGSALVVLTGG